MPYLLLFLAGAITTATQWRRIRTSAWKKLLYTFTFPIFMATYVPITIFALFAIGVQMVGTQGEGAEGPSGLRLPDLRSGQLDGERRYRSCGRRQGRHPFL